MPQGPRGESRSADAIGCAVAVACIATGEAEDDRYTTPGRIRGGRSGAAACMEQFDTKWRSEVAKRAMEVRSI